MKLNIEKFTLLLSGLLFSFIAFAQDSSVSSSSSSVTTTTTTETWYTQPWAWVLGGAIFLVILIALLRGNSRSSTSSDRVTVTKSVERDSDV